MSKIPKGCYKFIDHKCILAKDINLDRPTDQCNISTEQAIRHSKVVKKRGGFLCKSYWAVLSTTTYEMAGSYSHTYCGGRAWAETDMTGLEWRFDNKKDANEFAFA